VALITTPSYSAPCATMIYVLYPHHVSMRCIAMASGEGAVITPNSAPCATMIYVIPHHVSMRCIAMASGEGASERLVTSLHGAQTVDLRSGLSNYLSLRGLILNSRALLQYCTNFFFETSKLNSVAGSSRIWPTSCWVSFWGQLCAKLL